MTVDHAAKATPTMATIAASPSSTFAEMDTSELMELGGGGGGELIVCAAVSVPVVWLVPVSSESGRVVCDGAFRFDVEALSVLPELAVAFALKASAV